LLVLYQWLYSFRISHFEALRVQLKIKLGSSKEVLSQAAKRVFSLA